MQPQTYPQDYSCIVSPQGQKGGIFIGNLQAAQNIRTLQKHNIKAILTAAKGITLPHPKQLIPYSLYIAATDHQSFDISIFFDQAADFMADILSHTNIMVHCLAGVSRSVSLVIAYFIKYRQMSYAEAYQLIKSKRKIIHPNDSFISQLKIYHEKMSQHGRNRSMSPQIHPISPQKNNQRCHYQSTEQFSLKKIVGSFSPKKYGYEENQEIGEFQRQKSHMTYNYGGLYRNRAESSYFSPSKDKKEHYSQYKGQIKHLSSANTSVLGSNHKNQEQKRDYNPSTSAFQNTSQVDITDIDRKIEQIRKKYQEYTNNPISSMNHYGGYEGKDSSGSTYNKNVWARPNTEESKKRQYNYLNQFQRDVRRRPSAAFGLRNY